MKYPKIENLLGLFGKKKPSKPTGTEPAGTVEWSPTHGLDGPALAFSSNKGKLMLGMSIPAKESTEPSTDPATPSSGETPSEPPFLIFLDEMGHYLPSSALSSHVAVVGTSAKGKSSFSAVLEASERQATKLVVASGNVENLAEWSALSDPATLESWKSWLPSLHGAELDEEDALCVQLLLKCPMTCAELYEALSIQFPGLVITVDWYKPAPIAI